ncbi:MAG TPA: hypothetical protein VGA88_08825 [Burkholderiales bacterium]
MPYKTTSCLLLAAFFLVGSQAFAKDALSGQEVLATAKIAGACGILDSMIQFQKTTKMEGGDEFVTRFWTLESARLGLSVKQMSERCNGAITLYDKLWKSMELKTK